jgi:hypothetical protein
MLVYVLIKPFVFGLFFILCDLSLLQRGIFQLPLSFNLGIECSVGMSRRDSNFGTAEEHANAAPIIKVKSNLYSRYVFWRERVCWPPLVLLMSPFLYF